MRASTASVFCKFSESFGKVSCLSRIDGNSRHSVCDKVCEEFSFESSSGFEDDLFRFDFLEVFHEFLDSFFGIRNGELLVAWQDVHNEFVLGNIDTNKGMFFDGVVIK